MESSSQESQLDSVISTQSSEDASPTRSGRGLRERKKVVYNERKMAVKATTESSDESEPDDDKEAALDDDEVDEEARWRPLELWTEGESTSTTEEASQDSKSGVTGHELFGFKQSKRKDALIKTVTYSTNAARSESEAEKSGNPGTPKKETAKVREGAEVSDS